VSPEHRHIPEPGEVVYRPSTSWAPAIFAFALALTVCGIFAEGFMVRGWIYALIAGVAALLVFRALIADGVRDFYRLRRKQKFRGAVLPIETVSPPAKR